MSRLQHGPECWRDHAHHACATAAMGQALGARDEARAVAADALARVAELTEQEKAVVRVRSLIAEFRADLETKGADWHPKFRSAVEKIVAQLAAALPPEVAGG